MYQNEKVDMRVKYTREWTFEALYRLLEVKKYEDIKISEIIKKAGISRATFYRNFSTKDDIVKIKVRVFFEDFINSVFEHYAAGYSGDEIYLIQFFFKRIDEEEKLVDTVIKTKLEYLMVNGILELINIRREQFYSIVKMNKKAETYTMEIVASSAWTLLSRWHRSGKEESSSELSNIYSSAFKSVYIALFGDKAELNK
ncbi:MAG: TetR/AcrR family transcriptional regulator [Candidatus Izimaplasma sp.]|nr:TetR/AcrR family transcriptional regulator [Candidatus Izimaplasma bacterium]